jgi:ArsR family transcriptional regulator
MLLDRFLAVHRSAALSRRFHALADETRLRIVDRLRDGEECVCNLTGPLGTPQSLLSFHLRTLKEAGLIHDRKQGRWVYYALNLRALDETIEALEAFKKPRRGLRLVPPQCP